MAYKSRSRTLLGAGVGLAQFACLGLGGIMVTIRFGLQRYADEATALFPGDRNEALIRLVDCDECSLEDRNHAVWTLGQMQVEPALVALKRHYGGKCAHEWKLCQYELRKAIRRIEWHGARQGRLWRFVAKLHQPWR
jgi:hypothetical protein